MLTPAEIAAIAAKALENKKARDVKVLKTAEQTVLADYFVICNGTSSTHIKALVDFGCVIVHVFTDEARKFYNLERLWSDSEEIDPATLPLPPLPEEE